MTNMKLSSRLFLPKLNKFMLLSWLIAFLVVSLVSFHSFAFAEQARAKIKIATSMGDMVFELYPDQSPQTVQHFLTNANQGIYDGTIFHKVVPDFVVQGGGFDVNFRERTVIKTLSHEGQDAVTKGSLRNKYGVISLARGADKDSAGLEFFINVANNPDLDPVPIPPGDPVPAFEYNGNLFKNIPRKDLTSAKQLWGFTPFASIVSGQAVLEKIRKTNTGALGPFSSSVPIVPVVIQSVRLIYNPNNSNSVLLASSYNTNTNTNTNTSINSLNSNATSNASNTSSIAQSSSSALTTSMAASTAVPNASVSSVSRATPTENTQQEVLASIEKWAQAWRIKDIETYLAAYVPNFKPEKFKTHQDWANFRKARIEEKSKITLKVVNPQVKLLSEKVEVKFLQQYSADGVNSNGPKTLQLIKVNNQWLISKEDS